VVLQRPMDPANADHRSTILDWAEPGRRQRSRPVACLSRRPILSTFSILRHDVPLTACSRHVAMRCPHWEQENIYAQIGETCSLPSGRGWVVGHSYIVYAALRKAARPSVRRQPVVTPECLVFLAREISKHNAPGAVPAPTAFLSHQADESRWGAYQKYGPDGFRTLFLARAVLSSYPAMGRAALKVP